MSGPEVAEALQRSAVALGVAVDKQRLLRGEPTAVSETRSASVLALFGARSTA